MDVYTPFTEKKAREVLNAGTVKAQRILDDPKKAENFLQQIHAKMEEYPADSELFENVPVLAELAEKYLKKEYTDIPRDTVTVILSALSYLISPVDYIPDSLPIIGYSDDAMVLLVCWQIVEPEVNRYREAEKA